MASAPHQYTIFNTIEGVSNKLPVLRDVQKQCYIKWELFCFLLGFLLGCFATKMKKSKQTTWPKKLCWKKKTNLKKLTDQLFVGCHVCWMLFVGNPKPLGCCSKMDVVCWMTPNVGCCLNSDVVCWMLRCWMLFVGCCFVGCCLLFDKKNGTNGIFWNWSNLLFQHTVSFFCSPKTKKMVWSFQAIVFLSILVPTVTLPAIRKHNQLQLKRNGMN